MPHTPQLNTTAINILEFEEAIKISPKKLQYNRDEWIYIPKSYEEYRYILGTNGKNPLICIGINPSTAKPGDLDNTLKAVKRITLVNGFDSFIMLNVYAQRATKPKDVEMEKNILLHRENMKALKYSLNLLSNKSPSIWAAWGGNIEKRPYFIDCLKDIVNISKQYNAHWYWVKKRRGLVHPHHPIGLLKEEKLQDFDIDAYMTMIL